MDKDFTRLSYAGLDPALNSFNAVRLIAASQVLLVHIVVRMDLEYGLWFRFLQHFPGVPLFFALSGFLVLHSYLSRPSMGSFVRARAFRIYPALIVNIFVLEVLFAIGGGVLWERFSPLTFLAYEFIYLLTASREFAALLIGETKVLTGTGFFPLYPSNVLWTLTVEISFYIAMLALSPLAALSRWLATLVFLGLALTSLFFAFQFHGSAGPGSWLYYVRLTFVPYFWMFAIGMIARLWVDQICKVWPWLFFGIIVTLCATIADFGTSTPEWNRTPTFVGVFKVFLVCSMALLVGLSGYLRNEWMARNDISYGLYLWHMLPITTVVALGWQNSFLAMAGCAALAYFAGWLSWNHVEAPAMACRRRRSSPTHQRVGLLAGSDVQGAISSGQETTGARSRV